MISNQGAFRILSSIAFETVKSQTEEKQKSMISAKRVFHFQIFETFGNSETYFGVTLKECFVGNMAKGRISKRR